MPDDSSSDALSRRAFLRRLGGRSASESSGEREGAAEPDEEESAGDASENEPVRSPEAARRKLEGLGVSLMPLSEEEDLLQVQCKRVGTQFGPEQMRLLEPLAPRIAWLNLARTGIGDDALELVGGMTNLQRLYLQHTSVEGAGLAALTGIETLEYLNLFGTKVGDDALDHVIELEGLQTVYLLQTEVSEEGVQALRERRPDLTVEFGDPFF